jgi:beta-aspartyl-peptidase (threonine type)
MSKLIAAITKSPRRIVSTSQAHVMALIIAFAIPTLLCCSWQASAGAQERAASHSNADQEIRSILDAQVVSWNKGDLEGFMTGYWKSPELTFFSGSDVTSGWQQTLDRYRKRYQSEGREMGKLAFSELQIKPAGDSAAWVRGRWKLVTSKETLGGLFTLIFQRTPDGWRIVHDHTSSGPSPSTQPAAPPKKD